MPLIDKHLPRYQFSERHRTHVRASPDEVMRAVIDLDRPPDRLTAFLLNLRTAPSRLLGRETPPAGMPLFTPLERGESSETVSGLIGRFWRLDGGLVPISHADAFARFAEPGTPKLVTAFRTTPHRLGTLLTTETRVFCPDLASLLRFAPYWMLIRLPSGLIRRRMLRAIKNAAERRAKLSPSGGSLRRYHPIRGHAGRHSSRLRGVSLAASSMIWSSWIRNRHTASDAWGGKRKPNDAN